MLTCTLTAALCTALSQACPNPEAVPYLSATRTTQFTSPEWVTDPRRKYCMVIDTNKGAMVFALYPQVAPKTVNSMVFLSLNHYYEGIKFHRVLDGFMAQTGDPLGTGSGGPGYAYNLEIDPKYSYDKAGMLAMARTSDPNSNGSQFFITFAPAAFLNNQYTIFGQQVGGLEVLPTLQRIDPGNPNPKITPDIIKTVTIYTNGTAEPTPAAAAVTPEVKQ